MAAGQIIRRYWLNVLIATLLVYLPLILFAVIALSLGGMYRDSTISTLLALFIEGATVYVLPIVFLKNENLLAVLGGIVFLFRNFSRSVPVLLIVSASYVAALLLVALARNVPEHLKYLPLVVAGLTVSYLTFVAFAAATNVVVGRNEGAIAGAT